MELNDFKNIDEKLNGQLKKRVDTPCRGVIQVQSICDIIHFFVCVSSGKMYIILIIKYLQLYSSMITSFGSVNRILKNCRT